MTSWNMVLAVRPHDFKLAESLDVARAGLPWAGTLIWPSQSASLWMQVTDEKAVHEEKAATRIVRQVVPLCREDTEYYAENGPVVRQLSALIFGRNFKVLPFRSRLDVVMEIRHFAAEAGEKFTAVLGGENCALLRELCTSGALRPEHFSRDLTEEDDYPALFEEAMLQRKGTEALLMREEDMNFWREKGGNFTESEVFLPVWPEKSVEELLALRGEILPAMDELFPLCRALAKASPEEAASVWKDKLLPVVAALPHSGEDSARRVGAAMLEGPGRIRRLALILR